MKIGFVVISFPVASETFILNQIAAFLDLGHDVQIFAQLPPEGKTIFHDGFRKYRLADQIVYFSQFIPKNKFKRLIKGLPLIGMNLFRNFSQTIKALNFLKFGKEALSLRLLYLTSLFARKDYDVIHCHFGTVGREMIYLKDIFPKIKFIVSFYGFDIRLGQEKGGEFYKRLFSKSDLVIANARNTIKELIELGCPKEKIVHLSNGVDLEKFKLQARPKKGYCQITTVARLVKEKNILFTLDVIKRLSENQKINFKYFLVGDGYLAGDIKIKIHELKLENYVIMLGAQSQESIIDILRETDIFLLLSREESFGVVLLEAQAMQVPVVASCVGGIPEAVRDGRTGFLVKDNDIQDAVEKITRLIDHSDLRKQMGQSGRQFVQENFDLKKLSGKLEKIYKTYR